MLKRGLQLQIRHDALYTPTKSHLDAHSLSGSRFHIVFQLYRNHSIYFVRAQSILNKAWAGISERVDIAVFEPVDVAKI